MTHFFKLVVKLWGHFSTKGRIVGSLLILTAVGGSAAVLLRSPQEAPTLKVERRDVIEAVEVTGTAKAPSKIKLEFLSSGRVVSRPRKVGDAVGQGQVLMALDASDLSLEIKKSEAELLGARAKLEQLKAPASAETLKQLENAVVSNYRTAISALDAALTRADNARTVLRADVYLETNRVRTEFNLPFDGTTSKAEDDKARADVKLFEARAMRDAVGGDLSDFSAIDSLLEQAPLLLDSVRAALVSASGLLRRVVSPSVSQATIVTYLNDISTAAASLDSAMKTLADSVSALRSAKDALSIKKESPRTVDVDVLEASIKAAEVTVELLTQQKRNMLITAPVNGVITDLAYEVGEIARVGTPAVSMISSGSLEIEANVPEADVVKIAPGQPVTIAIDALPDAAFEGRVIHVDPAETIIDGVTNYKVRVTFEGKDPRVKTGVTANLSIETLRKTSVLALSQLGVIERDAGAFVKKIIGDEIREFSVETGIRSADGYVEILSGLSEGEVVLNAGIKTEK